MANPIQYQYVTL